MQATGDLSLWAIAKIVFTVLGSGALLGGTIKLAQLFFERHDRKLDKKESELEKHITDAAAIRKLDDARSTDLYNRVKEQSDKCEEEKGRLEERIIVHKKRVRLYRRNAKLCLGQLSDAERQVQKISDMIEFGFKLEHITPQIPLLASDLQRLRSHLEQDPEEDDLRDKIA